MPKKDPVDITEEQAKHNVEEHEKKHGHDMSDKVPAGKGGHDIPSKRDLDEEFEWAKQGKDRPAHPDD